MGFINRALAKVVFALRKNLKEIPADIKQDKGFMDLYQECTPYTMTSVERMYALYNAIGYVLKQGIPGDFCECGVWKGGSSMMIALTLKKYNVTDRKIYLYDTFEGMSEPTEEDKSLTGDSAQKMLDSEDKHAHGSVWCYSGIDEVKKNLLSTGYPEQNLFFIKGKVEDTLPVEVPGNLALLRLDTDWYESTKIEMEVLYPLLQESGVLIIDDFGHWEGAKKAVLEYFEKQRQAIMLHRIDYTGRIMIKNSR